LIILFAILRPFGVAQKGLIMNKVITDGIVFMPPAFGDGLDVWSSADGLPGDPTYDGSANATLIASDADFGTSLELQKTQSVQKLRYTGQTPLSAGCYLRIRARIKAISGALPSVRIAGWAGDAGGANINGVLEIGPSVQLTAYGEVVEISAIVGTGTRTGVDMIWGRDAVFGHFGIDLTGNNGGIVRVEDIVIEDVSSVFYGKMLDIVDVKDFGAVGDGVTDNTAAFEAADAAANGRDILVSEGVYFIGQTVTFVSRIRFEGTLVMPDNAILQLTQNYNYGTYLDAFGDEILAFKKAFQALFNFTDHESLDLCGYSIALDGPIDLHAAVGNKNTFSSRRVLRNGQFTANAGANWDSDIVISTASYNAGNATKLTGVANIASIAKGSLVEGFGVGAEVYVKAVDVANQTLTLSRALWGAAASQTYTFTRFKYLLDMSGFTKVTRFTFENLDFNGSSLASGVMIAPDGLIHHFKDCFFTSNKDRGITSIGQGCAGMLIDRCQFLSAEQALDVNNRVSIAFNTNANDVKVRNNRAVRYKHFCIIGGTGNIITGNHFFQGDNSNSGEHTAGMIITTVNCKTTFVGNYVDNCYVEWTNEHDATPDLVTGFSFGGLIITGNIFMSSNAPSWFRWIHIKPFGTGQFLNGITITDNVFKAINGPGLDRVETVDTTHADLVHSKARNVTVTGNMFNGVSNRMQNPVTVPVARPGTNISWGRDVSEFLPFGGQTRTVISAIPEGPIRDASNAVVYEQPYATVGQGTNGVEFNITWSKPVKGKINVTVRSDDPT
jgi:pectate lyase-like protein